MSSTPIDDGSDDYYRALDGLILQGAWHVRVASVVVDDGYRWIQLDLVGPRRYSFLFRLMLAVDSMGVRHALQCWLAGQAIEDSTSPPTQWDGIVAMHMVSEVPRGATEPEAPRRKSLLGMVESAVEAVQGSSRAARRVLWRM
jgi:hypothetical protein